eukprot:4010023-Amphidinium_carterae.1
MLFQGYAPHLGDIVRYATMHRVSHSDASEHVNSNIDRLSSWCRKLQYGQNTLHVTFKKLNSFQIQEVVHIVLCPGTALHSSLISTSAVMFRIMVLCCLWSFWGCLICHKLWRQGAVCLAENRSVKSEYTTRAADVLSCTIAEAILTMTSYNRGCPFLLERNV